MKKAVIKISAMFLIVGLNWTGLSAIGGTSAYFNDVENIAENTFSAGSLDISLDSYSNYVSGLMYPTDATSTSIILSDNGSLTTQYVSKISLLSPDSGACNYVNLGATDGTQSYSGPLLNFISGTTTLASLVNWNYTFTIDPAAPASVWDKTCYFKWIFIAWGNDVAEPIGGFVDIEEKSGGIRIGKAIALNEILANPVGLDDALKPAGEWVELYNNSNVDFDVNGWVIYDFDDSHELYITTTNTNTGNTIVPMHGFLVVYRDGDSDFTINNDAETIKLYTGYPVSSSVLVDLYLWATEKPEGFSYARIPDGVGAWVDPVPTPGEPNVSEAKEKEIIFGSALAEESLEPEQTIIVVEEAFATSSEEIAAIATSTAVAAENSISIEAEQVPPEETTIIIEEQPAIEEQPIVIEQAVSGPEPEPELEPELELESEPELAPENNSE